MKQEIDLVNEDGWLEVPHDLPPLDVVEAIPDLVRSMYDVLERMTREVRAGNVSTEVLRAACEVMALARGEEV